MKHLSEYMPVKPTQESRDWFDNAFKVFEINLKIDATCLIVDYFPKTKKVKFYKRNGVKLSNVDRYAIDIYNPHCKFIESNIVNIKSKYLDRRYEAYRLHLEIFPEHTTKPHIVDHMFKPRNSIMMSCIEVGSNKFLRNGLVKRFCQVLDIDEPPTVFTSPNSPFKNYETVHNFIYGTIPLPSHYWYKHLMDTFELIPPAIMRDTFEIEGICIYTESGEFKITDPAFRYKLKQRNQSFSKYYEALAELFGFAMLNLEFHFMTVYNKFANLNVLKYINYQTFIAQMAMNMYDSILLNEDMKERVFYNTSAFKMSPVKLSIEYQNDPYIKMHVGRPGFTDLYRTLLYTFQKPRKRRTELITSKELLDTINEFNDNLVKAGVL